MELMDLEVSAWFLKADQRPLISFKGFLQKHFNKAIGKNNKITYKNE